MTSLTITTTGAREISEHLEQFTPALHARLKARITEVSEQLWARIESVVPHLTGRLASEITNRVFSDTPNRVAAYESVYSAEPGDEYAKAGALEYGRHAVLGTKLLIFGGNRKMKARLSKGNMLGARRYLRGPFDEMKPEILAAMEEAVAETVAEENA